MKWKTYFTTSLTTRNIIHYSEEGDKENEDYKLIDRLKDSNTPTKLVYNSIIKEKCQAPLKALEKWRTNINIHTSDAELLSTHTKLRKLVIN